MVDGKRPKILLCLSGSVSVVKIPQLAVMLAEFAEVRNHRCEMMHDITRATLRGRLTPPATLA